MKKIDKLLLRSFAGPFAVTFLITLFVLVMQFLWKYIDDLVGKGLEWYLVAKLLFFASASFVSLALPLAILLSSIMTMGALAEHYELTALKSAGVSLIKISRSLIVAALAISFMALLFANYVLPVANLKFGSLLYDVRQKRPALNIKPGVFYNGLAGYSMRVGSKDPDGQTIYDVLIYDHRDGRGDVSVLHARKGKMYMSQDKRFMFLELFDGRQYQEMDGSRNQAGQTQDVDQARVNFATWKKIFDLAEFKMNRTQESLFKDDYRMLDLRQLSKAIDTLSQEDKALVKGLRKDLSPYLTMTWINMDSFTNKHSIKTRSPADTILAYEKLSQTEYSTLHFKALNQIRNMKGLASIASQEDVIKRDFIVKHRIEFQRKFTLSIACFLLFLIGAPLGAIIRKGGLGLPFVISVIFFVFFYTITVLGEKFALQGIVSAATGMWVSSVVLLPIGLYLMYKASHDSSLFKLESWTKFLKRFSNWANS